MSHFYGTIDGSAKTKATRQGSKKTGLVTHCASWRGAVRCEAYIDGKGQDCVRVELVPWEGEGVNVLIATVCLEDCHQPSCGITTKAINSP